MTDPFKNQRYSSNSSILNNNNEVNVFSQQFRQASSINESIKNNKVELDENEKNLKQQDAFMLAHIQSNKELIKQLKSNIELLFKGTIIVGRFVFYPFSALRWQCQINSESYKYHLTPFTLMPVIYNLNYSGFYTLWKGSFSMAAYNGIKLVAESVLSEVTSFEKNIEDVNKPNKLYGHALLKFLAASITTPIFSAVIYESVQSGVSHENIGLLDLLKETWNRITGYKYNYRTRLIPFWYLILPTSVYFVGLHFVSSFLEKFTQKSIQLARKLFNDKKRRVMFAIDEVEMEVIETPYMDSLTQLTSRFAALILLYPIETIIHRLIVQGTRTIIDNTDNGFGVMPINTRYEGFIDCAQSIHQSEGVLGFYKGMGSLFLDAAFQFALLKLAKVIATRLFDSEWTTRTDLNNIKNLMSSSSLTLTTQYSSNNENNNSSHSKQPRPINSSSPTATDNTLY